MTIDERMGFNHTWEPAAGIKYITAMVKASGLYFSDLCTMNVRFPLITVLGPTAVGKTSFAAHLASELGAEILSADSRQVFRSMDIGTGKDLEDYRIHDHIIPSHLIDIAEPGTEYSVFQFQRDFETAYAPIGSRGNVPILCGGTGLYLESVLLGYDLNHAPENLALRDELALLNDEELVARLLSFRHLHNSTDTLDRERLIRAIEIENHKQIDKNLHGHYDFRGTPVFGLRFERKVQRERITARLIQRLGNGMTEEVRHLLDLGISAERLKMYGLEYKYITLYLEGELNFDQMFLLLNTAIHQFAKRQMTWFRRMENKGITITWLDGEDGLKLNLQKALALLKSA